MDRTSTRSRLIGMTLVVTLLLTLGHGVSLAGQRASRAFEPVRLITGFVDRLNLTPQQRAEIRVVLEAHQADLTSLVEREVAARAVLFQAIHQPETNEQAVRLASRVVASADADLAIERAEIYTEVSPILTEEQKAEVAAFTERMRKLVQSDLERTNEGKEKTGEFTGSYVVNPFNGEQIPVWIGDYVLGSYGTGAVMAVPAHDERDFEFAKKMNLKVIESVSGGDILPFTNDGTLINSAEFTGLTSAEAREKLAQKAESEGFGRKKINYKLRDWLFSRQRYWGEPIPLIHLAMEDVKQLPHISDISEATDMNLAYILKRDEID